MTTKRIWEFSPGCTPPTPGLQACKQISRLANNPMQIDVVQAYSVLVVSVALPCLMLLDWAGPLLQLSLCSHTPSLTCCYESQCCTTVVYGSGVFCCQHVLMMIYHRGCAHKRPHAFGTSPQKLCVALLLYVGACIYCQHSVLSECYRACNCLSETLCIRPQSTTCV